MRHVCACIEDGEQSYVLVCKNAEATGEWRKWHNEKLYSTQTVVTVIK